MANIRNRMQSNLHAMFQRGKGQKKTQDPRHENIHSIKTLETYLAEVGRYADWLKLQGAKGRCSEAEALDHLQDYIDYLVAAGKSPSSVHTAAAGICKALGGRLEDFDRPKRAQAPQRGRRPAPSLDGRNDADAGNPKFQRLVAFARAVGIRREEYRQLRGADFVTLGNYSYVVVQQGKGGKRQFQRIAPEDVPLVKSYFDGLGPDDPVFQPAELRNKVNLHRLRRERAQRAYADFLARLKSEPGYREELVQELREAFERGGEDWRRNRDMRRLETSPIYHCRGGVRRDMRGHDRPVSYDRLAMLAVSVLHLAHWRTDVSVSNYLR